MKKHQAGGDYGDRADYREIHANPSLDEVWDLCVRNFLYDQEKYVSNVEQIFKDTGITKKSKIADVSAGGGFPAINLSEAGYQIDCFDGFASDLFNKNAQISGVNTECQKVLWEQLPEITQREAYDFIFCRGNSFIFAGGGWDQTTEVNMEKVKSDYAKTMKIFADMVKDGGYMYIDKFKDSELGHREKLATISVGGQLEDLVFSSERNPDDKLRRVFMERCVGDEVVSQETRITYDLSEDELVAMAKEAGFSEISRIVVPEEKHFDVWLAKK